jgi:hypothetical protein
MGLEFRASRRTVIGGRYCTERLLGAGLGCRQFQGGPHLCDVDGKQVHVPRERIVWIADEVVDRRAV